ncbi:MAG: hypothetical protein IID15_05650 [Candidatus Marinimicrobia bacterium]|nr:hypothetical protein [Candidatus Neomarinimicrobiota bacterium]
MVKRQDVVVKFGHRQETTCNVMNILTTLKAEFNDAPFIQLLLTFLRSGNVCLIKPVSQGESLKLPLRGRGGKQNVLADIIIRLFI